MLLAGIALDCLACLVGGERIALSKFLSSSYRCDPSKILCKVWCKQSSFYYVELLLV